MDVLVEKTAMAVERMRPKTLLMAGGVAANVQLRRALEDLAAEEGVPLRIPAPELCTDNAAMIAAAAWPQYARNRHSGMSLNAVPYLDLAKAVENS